MRKSDTQAGSSPAPLYPLVDSLRARGAGFTLAFLAGSLVFLVVLDTIAPQGSLLGIPGSVLATSIVMVSIFAGPWHGTLLALGDGVLFAAILGDHGISPAAAVFSVVLWIVIAIVAGTLTQYLRREISLREERLTESREEARALSADLGRILELAPRFHTETNVAGVGLEICAAAREAFSVDRASLYQVEGNGLRLLAREPLPSAFELGDVHVWADPEVLQPLSKPTFMGEISPSSPSSLVQELANRGDGALLGVPLGVGGASYYFLVLSWREPQSTPEPGFMAVVQRFADQAAAALSRVEALELHGRMEAGLYPRLPLQIPGVSVDVRFRAREQLLTMGGDFFGLIRRPDGDLGFVMGDVSGHGPDSAALGATLRASWRALAMSGADLTTTLEILDRVVLSDRRSEQQFVTLLAAQIEASQRTLHLVNAAHPPPILVGARAEFIECPPVAPLGFSYGSPRAVSRVRLPAKWRLLLYTDGLFEGRAAPGSSERFGLQWLLQRVSEAKRLDGSFLDGLLAEIQGAAQGGPLMDDVVAMLLSPGAASDAASDSVIPGPSQVEAVGS